MEKFEYIVDIKQIISLKPPIDNIIGLFEIITCSHRKFKHKHPMLKPQYLLSDMQTYNEVKCV